MRRFLVAGLLLAAAVGAQHNASIASSSVCTPIEMDVDYYGNDIKATTRTNPNDCCTDCAATPGCVVYVWNGVSTCYLKHTIGWQLAAPGARAAKHPVPSSPFCSRVLENQEYVGVDLSWSLQRHAEDCCDDCRKTPGCHAFVWTADDKGRCNLRRLVGDPTPRAGARSALVNKAAPVCTIEKDVDYYGNDIVSIPRDSADACCADCDATPNCIAYVWSTYTGRGVCNLKHTKGATSIALGAIGGTKGTTGAGSCGVPEPDIAYEGAQLATTSHALSTACCQDCADTPGCTFYVWSSGVCSLRANQGKKVSAPGSTSGTLRLPSTPAPQPPAPGPTKVQTRIFGEFPLPRIAYSVLSQSRWLETSAYKSFLEAFERIMTNETLQAQHAGQPHELLAASAYVRYFPRVTSAGECALVASTYHFSFFTFAATSQLCMAHTFSPSASAMTWMRTQDDGSFLQFAPQEFPTAFVRTMAAPTLAACQAACTDNCAGVGYTVDSGVCAVVVPMAHADADTDVVAGWVQNPHSWAETPNGIQYVTMTDRYLGDEIYKRVVATNINSVVVCAYLVAAQPDAAVNVLFLYDEPTQTCYTVPTTVSPLRNIQFVNYPASPNIVGKRLLRGLSSTLLVSALSHDDCHRQCLPSKSNCFASSYLTSTDTCSLYTALYQPRSTLGVISPQATLPIAPTTRASSVLFLTAHQDDHELFMSGQIAKAIADPNTAVAFIYMTAGDAGSTNGWYEAREAGTLAATRSWVQAAGRFDPVQRTSYVTILGHVVAKVEIGNVAHYFLRLPELGTIDLSKFGTPVSPMDRPHEVYATEADVQAVLLAIIKMEAKGRATLHSQQYEQMDHFLHAMAGRLIARAVAADPTLSTCLSTAYYWGYQKWLDPVNLPDQHTIELQRRAWLALSSIASSLYPGMSPWLDHIAVLGREYVASSVVRTDLCPA